MNQLCVWMCGGGRGGDQLVATKEIRTPKATSNKSTCQTPQKKNQKNQRGVYERKHKAKDYNAISKLRTDVQRICQDEGNKEATTLILLNFGSLLQWMNAWQTLVGLSSDDWFKPPVVFIFVVEELELWIGNFFYTYLPSIVLPPLGGCSPSLPFPNREPVGQFRVCKTPGWLTAVVNN